MYRTVKVCQECGRLFCGGVDCHYCKECAGAKKLGTVVKTRTCQICGAEFPGGPRAKYCLGCGREMKKETNRKHREVGAKRPLGSVDSCTICGKEYVVASGRQKYCSPSCQRIGVLEWQKEHKRGYSKKSGQAKKKLERRRQAKKVCAYCLQTFTSDTTTNLCSDYCRAEQKKLQQCIYDIKRGYKRDLKKYEDKRKKYRRHITINKD